MGINATHRKSRSTSFCRVFQVSELCFDQSRPKVPAASSLYKTALVVSMCPNHLSSQPRLSATFRGPEARCSGFPQGGSRRGASLTAGSHFRGVAAPLRGSSGGKVGPTRWPAAVLQFSVSGIFFPLPSFLILTMFLQDEAGSRVGVRPEWERGGHVRGPAAVLLVAHSATPS